MKSKNYEITPVDFSSHEMADAFGFWNLRHLWSEVKTWLRSEVERAIPLGHEDEHGFHFERPEDSSF